ncbi:ABC transporter ATP-binding protein [Marinilactibacillus sp. GCM10026970]|uniref:ABC transporter ATP-binding protein n=1 Tax=Marinilactibacillus sp. GCM10026970 TaxID=3252642 RepID=UPI003613CCF4
MLQIKKISKAFRDQVILDDVSLTIQKGEIIGLVAPNGTGKSTLLHIVMNFLKPDSGQIIMDGQLDYSTKKKEIKMRKEIAFLPEIDDLYQELTGLEHIAYYALLWRRSDKEVQEIVQRLEMSHYVKRPVKTYSLGMRQRLCFAMVLAADTQVMLMDEVMNGLDPDNVQLLTKILIELKEKNKIILIASHLLENLDLYADSILFLKDGKIVLEKRDTGDKDGIHIKVTVPEKIFVAMTDEDQLPEEAKYIAGRLVCIPVQTLTAQEVGEWTSFFYERGYTDLTIGKIGTSEWYSEFYHQEQ